MGGVTSRLSEYKYLGGNVPYLLPCHLCLYHIELERISLLDPHSIPIQAHHLGRWRGGHSGEGLVMCFYLEDSLVT